VVLALVPQDLPSLVILLLLVVQAAGMIMALALVKHLHQAVQLIQPADRVRPALTG
jgi:hypothetical protein